MKFDHLWLDLNQPKLKDDTNLDYLLWVFSDVHSTISSRHNWRNFSRTCGEYLHSAGQNCQIQCEHITSDFIDMIKSPYTTLKYLNLSRNRISSIETNSFINLNKLISLDLSFNQLHAIEARIFVGLNILNDLLLFDQKVELNFNNESFANLTSVGNIYLRYLTRIFYIPS